MNPDIPEDLSIPPLSGVPTDDLIDELERRSEACVVLYLLRAETGKGSIMNSVFEGGFFACLGMIEQAAINLKMERKGFEWRMIEE